MAELCCYDDYVVLNTVYSFNTGTIDLSDMNHRSPLALDIHIGQITCVHVTSIYFSVIMAH